MGILYDLYLAQPQKALEQFEQYLGLTGGNKQVDGWVADLRKRLGIKAPAPTPPAVQPEAAPPAAPGAAPANAPAAAPPAAPAADKQEGA